MYGMKTSEGCRNIQRTSFMWDSVYKQASACTLNLVTIGLAAYNHSLLWITNGTMQTNSLILSVDCKVLMTFWHCDSLQYTSLILVHTPIGSLTSNSFWKWTSMAVALSLLATFNECEIIMCTNWNLFLKYTLNKGHLSNEDTVCSPSHSELCTNLPLN